MWNQVRKSMCRIKHVLTERAIEEPDPRRSAEMKKMINTLWWFKRICFHCIVGYAVRIGHLISWMLENCWPRHKALCSNNYLHKVLPIYISNFFVCPEINLSWNIYCSQPTTIMFSLLTPPAECSLLEKLNLNYFQ
jgi:hypothetical protein